MPDLTLSTTVGDIVGHDLRTAAVFARHGIDFCCGGRTSLDNACKARGVDAATILRELESLDDSFTGPAGVVAMVLFVLGLATGHSVKHGQSEGATGVIGAPEILEA
jgi:hypothetical protein